MDPRNSWPQPEQNCCSLHHWPRVWETYLGIRDLLIEPSGPPGEEEDPASDTQNSNDMESYISLTDTNSNKVHNTNNKSGVNNLNHLNSTISTEPYQKRRRENKASTWGLNHSTYRREWGDAGCQIPWKPMDKIYPFNPQGCVVLSSICNYYVFFQQSRVEQVLSNVEYHNISYAYICFRYSMYLERV